MRHIIVNNGEIDLSFFRDFNKVEDKLSFKLIGIKENTEYLEDVPYKKFEDLAMVPICLVRNEKIGDGHITIKNTHLDMWGITYEDLWNSVPENAEKNTQIKIVSMADYLGEECVNKRKALEKILIVTNKEQNYGAGTVLLPGVLEKISDKYGKNLYVLPASVHETLVLPECGKGNEAKELENIVHQVNAGVLNEEEFLSDKIYYYEKSAGFLAICD
ncbi:MAG: hypothetical protein J5504_10665 [Butyrivibrio sp.]|nr:hypothetical protein [Butyrivibrio sp.]